ncbi:hypothetical protein OSTOST_10906 [Ostertagia ostertagi]
MTSQLTTSSIPEERICVDTGVVESDADEGTAPVAQVGQRRQRVNTVCGLTGPHGSTEDPALLSPRPHDRRYGSMLSLDPANVTPVKSMSVDFVKENARAVRRHRHGEYTSITDSISIQRDDRNKRQRRSMSNEHQESGPQSEDEVGSHEEAEPSTRQRRSIDRRVMDEVVALV